MSLQESISTPGFASTHHIKRSTTRDANPVSWAESDNRSFTAVFYDPKPGSTEYLSNQSWPAGKDPGWWYPPPHYHLIQDEHFLVTAGTGVFHFYDGSTKTVRTGESIVIPARKWHTFSRPPGNAEAFAIDYRYDREYKETQERFFRNAFSYFEDCRRERVPPNIFQVALFAIPIWMPLAPPTPRWVPEQINLLLGTLLTVILALIGWFQGYKTSYPEYYAETKEKSR